MRKIWISFSVATNKGNLMGDTVAGIPDGRPLDASFLNGIKGEIVAAVRANMKANEGDPVTFNGEPIFLAAIPLEEKMPRFRTPSTSIWHPAVGHRRFR